MIANFLCGSILCIHVRFSLLALETPQKHSSLCRNVISVIAFHYQTLVEVVPVSELVSN